MVYTVTLNPALDYVIELDHLKTGKLNRSNKEEIHYGGKGINVSCVLNQLGVPNVALGFVGGFTGKAIEEGVKELGIKTRFLPLKHGLSRINVKIKTGTETEINGQGPEVTKEDMEALLLELSKLTEKDILILAGSIPAHMPLDTYEQIMKYVQPQKVRVVVDTSRELLRNVLKYQPYLIKPNQFELSELLEVEITSVHDAYLCALKLREMGAKNVLVSMGSEGAILVDEEEHFYYQKGVQGKAEYSVGAGDSMVAGFVAGLKKYKDPEMALKLGCAAGSATAFAKGLAVKEEIEEIFKKME